MKRMHVNVTVRDLDASIRFYSTLFAAEPTVRKPDYAKWMLEDPRVNFAIGTCGSTPGIEHLGIQVEDEAELADVYQRLERAGGATLDEGETTCCYARSTKQWIEDPQGVAWETFLTHGEAPVYGHERGQPRSASKPVLPRLMTDAADAAMQVLVLCTGNACRSIMAEALINVHGGGRYRASSAGSRPTGTVHPRALATLARHGVAAPQARSKSWDEFVGKPFDLVITVCDSAAAEACPVFSGPARRLHWSIPDPASATGRDEEVDAAFQHTFDLLQRHIHQELT